MVHSFSNKTFWNSTMKIQWYPGHMKKAVREINKDLSLVDVIIEVLDSRCPFSTMNTEIEKMCSNKKILYILNKEDLADINKLKNIKNIFDKEGKAYISFDGRNNDISKKVNATIIEIAKDIFEKREKKHIIDKSIRAMVVGMPNVGKSTFINSYVKKKVAKAANTPGVTKAKSWIRISDAIELLDTPGITETKFSDENKGINLAIIGSINDNAVNIEELVLVFIEYLLKEYPNNIKERYNIDTENKTALEVYDEIALKNNCIKKTSKMVDYDRVAKLILKDFRNGLLGKISLE